MEVVLAVLRPQYPGEFSVPQRQEPYEPYFENSDVCLDILLVDTVSGAKDHKGRSQKEVPSFHWSNTDSNPQQTALQALYQLTGAEKGGLKGVRAIWVPPDKTSSQKSSPGAQIICIVVQATDKLNPPVVDQAPSTPGFYEFKYVVHSTRSGSLLYNDLTSSAVTRVERWLRATFQTDREIRALFRVPAQQRISLSVHNPAFAYDMTPRSRDRLRGSVDTLNSDQSADEAKGNAMQALAKMLEIEKCDKVIMNPLFGSGLTLKNTVNNYLVNTMWGHVLPEQYDFVRDLVMAQAKNVALHRAAQAGSLSEVESLLQGGATVDAPDVNGWTPLHYAAQRGHEGVMKHLLSRGSAVSPAAVDGVTPLHLAASEAHVKVTQLLCKQPSVNIEALTRSGKSPLAMCEARNKTSACKQCAKIIQDAIKKHGGGAEAEVWLMDNSKMSVHIPDGDRTPVDHMHTIMCRELNLGDCDDFFTLWICSKNLHLQLRGDHRPLQQLKLWHKTVAHYSDLAADAEKPRLYWRRNATLSLHKEKQVRGGLLETLVDTAL